MTICEVVSRFSVVLAALCVGANPLLAQPKTEPVVESKPERPEFEPLLKGWWQIRELSSQGKMFSSYRDKLLGSPRLKRKWMVGDLDKLVDNLNDPSVGVVADKDLGELLHDVLKRRQAGERTDIYVPWLLAVHRRKPDDLRVRLALAHALCTSELLGGFELGKKLCASIAERLGDAVHEAHRDQLLEWLPETSVFGAETVPMLASYARHMAAGFEAARALPCDAMHVSSRRHLQKRLDEQLRIKKGNPVQVIQLMQKLDPEDPYIDLLLVLVAGSKGRSAEGVREARQRWKKAMSERAFDREQANMRMQELGIVRAFQELGVTWQEPGELVHSKLPMREALFASKKGLEGLIHAAEVKHGQLLRDVDREEATIKKRRVSRDKYLAQAAKWQARANASYGQRKIDYQQQANDNTDKANKMQSQMDSHVEDRDESVQLAAEQMDRIKLLEARMRWHQGR